MMLLYDFMERKFEAASAVTQADGSKQYVVTSSAAVPVASADFLNGAVAGTVVASKALVAGSGGGISFASLSPAFASQEAALIGIGTYTVPMTIADTGATFVPIQVNLASTGNVASAGNQVACARLRVDAKTNAQANTALSCLQLRSDIGVNVYAATCISASLNVSANVALPTATMQGIYVAITGAGAITCPNNVNVLEAVYKQTTGGAGVDNTAELACNASGCALTDIVKVINYAGTVTNGVEIAGVMTNGILINTGCTVGINFTDASFGVTDSRAIKISTSQANAAMADGYGVVEIDHTITGTAASNFSGCPLSSWVNIPSGTVGAGKYVCAQNNGVYEASAATITNAKIVFGMRAQKLLDDTDALSFPFSVNTNNTAITAFVDVNNTTDLGWTTGAGTNGGGKIPFARDAAGNILYVNTYTS